MKIPDFGTIEVCGLSNDITAALAKELTFGQFLALRNPHRT